MFCCLCVERFGCGLKSSGSGNNMEQWPTASRRWIWSVDISRQGVFRTVLSLRQTTPATLQMVDRLRLSGSRTETGCNNGRWQKGWGLIFLQTTLLKKCRRYRIPNHFQIKLFAQCGCPKSTYYINVLLCLGVSQVKSEVGQTDPQTTFTPVMMEALPVLLGEFSSLDGPSSLSSLATAAFCLFLYRLPCWWAVCWHVTGICPGETLKKRCLMMFWWCLGECLV